MQKYFEGKVVAQPHLEFVGRDNENNPIYKVVVNDARDDQKIGELTVTVKRVILTAHSDEQLVLGEVQSMLTDKFGYNGYVLGGYMDSYYYTWKNYTKEELKKKGYF